MNAINRLAEAYWNRRAATFTCSATTGHERWLTDLLALQSRRAARHGLRDGRSPSPWPAPGAPRPRLATSPRPCSAILDKRTAAEKPTHRLPPMRQEGRRRPRARVRQRGRRCVTFPQWPEPLAPFVIARLAACSSRAVVVPASLPPSSDPHRAHLGRATKLFRNARKSRAARNGQKIPTCAAPPAVSRPSLRASVLRHTEPFTNRELAAR